MRLASGRVAETALGAVEHQCITGNHEEQVGEPECASKIGKRARDYCEPEHDQSDQQRPMFADGDRERIQPLLAVATNVLDVLDDLAGNRRECVTESAEYSD